MKPYLALSTMFLTAACTSPEQRRHVEIMDAIEHAVQIPPEAEPLSQFARTYKYASSTRVAAFYFIPANKTDEWFCKGAKEGGPKTGKYYWAVRLLMG